MYYTNEAAKDCSLSKEIRIEEGTRVDYGLLAGFHYRSHNVGVVRKIFRAARGDEICGVLPCFSHFEVSNGSYIGIITSLGSGKLREFC
ncbi:MAG TPA: hypothetical protein VJ249_03030 [Candidatus Bathyarchaeia archaeon]|nr:hypothetical protein [Candidatus Bathyarchaeia archaeon]